MSLITWKEEFFDEELNKKLLAAKSLIKKRGLTLQALDASIKKWGGMSQKNLKKHKLQREEDNYGNVFFKDKEGRELNFRGSCHLCTLYNYDKIDSRYSGCCEGCPLNSIENDARCSEGSTFDYYMDGNVRSSAMVKKLKEARKFWVKEYARMFPPKKRAK